MTVPNLDGVVPQTGHNLVVVVLKTVNALGILGSAIDSLQVVVAGAPVVFDRVDVLRIKKVMKPSGRNQKNVSHLHDDRVELSVERVIAILAGPRDEQVLDPFLSLRQPAPQRVASDLSLDELLPQHAFGDDAVPLLGDELGGEQRVGVEVRENVVGHMIQALLR